MKILLASVLKPIDDPRMYEKIGRTLAENHEVHIVGHQSIVPEINYEHPWNYGRKYWNKYLIPAAGNIIPDHPSIRFYPLFNFKANKQKRWKVTFQLVKLLGNLKPDLLVVHAPELLPLALWYKLRFRKKTIYDVQENYARNFWYQAIYPWWKKILLAPSIRLMEWSSRLFIDHYFLAEKAYDGETKFHKGKNTILENKYAAIHPQLSKKVVDVLRFAIVGTLSDLFGSWEGIALVEKLREAGYSVGLTIAGKFNDPKLADKVKKFVEQRDYIELLGGDEAIPHSMIVQLMMEADIVLLPYQPNRSTENCIPTKMYECLALGIPMIVSHNPLWEKICKPHNPALFLEHHEFDNADPKEIFEKIRALDSYPNGPAKEAYWETKIGKLEKVIAIL